MGRSGRKQAKRIASILETHRILYESPFAGMDADGPSDFEGLFGFEQDRDGNKIRRLKSIVRAYGTLFAGGILEPDPTQEQELDDLIAYLSGLEQDSSKGIKRADIVPANLGAAFARKRLGIPLFGPYRPPRLPRLQGTLLRYQAAEADGAARLAAADADVSTAVRYRHLGLEIDAEGEWLHCAIAPQDEPPRLLPAAAFSGKAPTKFVHDSFTVYLAASRIRMRLREEVDPFHYQYAYFFMAGGSRNGNISRYLRDLLTGMFGIPERDTAAIAREFIERLS